MGDPESSKKLLIFDGKYENFLVWKERFQSYLLCKSVPILTIEANVDADKREAMQRLLYCELILHLTNSVLQVIISIGENNGFIVWDYLTETYGKVKACQIVTLWKEFIDVAKLQNEGTLEFINRFDLIVYKLSSAKEVISDNLKIACLLRALPSEFDPFVTALQFQSIDFKTLKSKIVEKSLSMDEPTQSGFYDIAGKASYNSNRFPRVKCTNCGKPNHKVERCWAPGGPLYKSNSYGGPQRDTISGFTFSGSGSHDSVLDIALSANAHDKSFLVS